MARCRRRGGEEEKGAGRHIRKIQRHRCAIEHATPRVTGGASLFCGLRTRAFTPNRRDIHWRGCFKVLKLLYNGARAQHVADRIGRHAVARCGQTSLRRAIPHAGISHQPRPEKTSRTCVELALPLPRICSTPCLPKCSSERGDNMRYFFGLEEAFDMIVRTTKVSSCARGYSLQSKTKATTLRGLKAL